MTTASAPETTTVSAGARRFGYGVSIAISVGLLFVIGNLAEWVPWITGDFADVVPVLSVSIIVGIVANVMYMLSDDRRVKALGEAATTIVGLIALIMLLRVFPFDFAAYSFNWEVVSRGILVVAIVGSVVGIVVSGFKLVKPDTKGS